MNKISPLTSETIAISHRSIPEFEESPRWVRAMFGGETMGEVARMVVEYFDGPPR